MPKRHPTNRNEKTVNAKPEGSEYMAAVRYHDGSSELIRIKDADNLADARAMVNDQILNVHTMLIALRNTNY